MNRNAVGYRAPDVCVAIGITYRNLDYWARTDLVRPTAVDAHGSGSNRLYSYADLVRLKIIKNLLDQGITLQHIRAGVETMPADDINPDSVLIIGRTITFLVDAGSILDAVHSGPVTLLPMRPLLDELAADLSIIEPKTA